MKVHIGADHAGFRIKEGLKVMLAEWGHEVVDDGTDSEDSCDYPDFAKKVAKAVGSGKADRGILICGTGIGMSMVANRTTGVLAACVHDRVTAEMSRRHNNSNVFCAGARIVPATEIENNLRTWLETAFEGGRHSRRVDKITKRRPQTSKKKKKANKK